MGFYTKSLEDINEQHAVTSSEAPVSGMDERFAACLKSATIVALIEDYLRCGMKHQKFQSGDEMIAFAKQLCSEAMDGGDLSAEESNHVIAWCEAHRAEAIQGGNKFGKFVKHVCGEEVTEICGECECLPEDIKRAAEVKKQCEQMGADMAAKYGHLISGFASEFLARYGKNFDERFRDHLGL